MRATHTKRTALASDLGVSDAYVTMLVNDNRDPSLPLALKIHKRTNGALPLKVLLKRSLASASDEAVKELEAMASEQAALS